MTPQECEAMYDSIYLGMSGKYDALKYNFKTRLPKNICNGVFYKLANDDTHTREEIIRLFTLTILNHGSYKKTLGQEETSNWKEYLARLQHPNLYFSKEIKDLSIDNLKKLIHEDEFGSELARKVLGGSVHPITLLQIASITGCLEKWKWNGWKLGSSDKFVIALKFMQFSKEEKIKFMSLFTKS